MSRVEVQTNKEIRPDQLKVELGGVDVFTSEGLVQAEGVTQQQLDDAVATHVPDDDFGKDAEGKADEPTLEAFLTKSAPTAAETIDALKTLIRCR